MISGKKKLERAVLMKLPKDVTVQVVPVDKIRLGRFLVQRTFGYEGSVFLSPGTEWSPELYHWDISSLEMVQNVLIARFGFMINMGGCSVCWAFGDDMTIEERRDGYLLYRNVDGNYGMAYSQKLGKWGDKVRLEEIDPEGCLFGTLDSAWRIAEAEEMRGQ